MDSLNYYNKQAMENYRLFSIEDNINNSIPPYSFLTFDPQSTYGRNGDSENNSNIRHDLLLFFLQYLIAFPIFLLCWIAIVSYLRRMGHITRSGAESMMDELKDIRIARPPSILKWNYKNCINFPSHQQQKRVFQAY